MALIQLDETNLKIWQETGAEEKRYEFSNLKPGDYCIDVGSYRREWADEMIRRYSVEVDCFDALDNRAAWLFGGDLPIGGAYYYSSALLPPTDSVRCEDLCKYLKRPVAVLKMNIEGGEYQLLNHIMPLIRNIRILQVQFHIVEKMEYMEAYEAIRAELIKTHSPQWRCPFVWEQWERI